MTLGYCLIRLTLVNKTYFRLFLFFILFFVSLISIQYVFAEQVGGSPESGATSRIKAMYNNFSSLGYGSIAAGSWGNWGSIWNMIYSTGLAATAAPIDYSYDSLVEWDDYLAGDSTQEEASWTNSAGTSTGGVWKDNRTGLYWSASSGQNDNIFPDTNHSTCDFFQTNPKGNYNGSDAQCGDAINTCGNYSLEAVTGQGVKTDWYLPTQAELMQAYIDGAYNQNSTWATTNYFWSSTEGSNTPSNAWSVNLSTGYTDTNVKTTTTRYVRCVRRD